MALDGAAYASQVRLSDCRQGWRVLDWAQILVKGSQDIRQVKYQLHCAGYAGPGRLFQGRPSADVRQRFIIFIAAGKTADHMRQQVTVKQGLGACARKYCR